MSIAHARSASRHLTLEVILLVGGLVTAVPCVATGQEAAAPSPAAAGPEAGPIEIIRPAVENRLHVHVADGMVYTRAVFHILPGSGQPDEVRIGVPLDHRLLDVSGPRVESWSVERDRKSQIVTVSISPAEVAPNVIEVDSECPAPAGAFVPAGVDDKGVHHGIHLLGEVREKGLLVISHKQNLRLSVDSQSDLTRLDPSDLPPEIRRSGTLSYRYFSPRFSLQLTALPVEPRLSVEQNSQLVFHGDELRLTARLQYLVEEASVGELQLKMPAGLTIDRVDCPLMSEHQAAEGSDQLIVSLREETQGPITLIVTGRIALDQGGGESAPLPLLEPQETARETGSVAVYAPASLDLIIDEPKVRGALRTEGDPSGIAPDPELHLAAAWVTLQKPEIPVRRASRAARLAASVATRINVRPEATDVASLLSYDVSVAGLDTFRFAIPQAAENVRIEATGADITIRRTSRSENPAEGWFTWTVELARELTGQVSLEVRYELKSDAAAARRVVAVSPLRVVPSPGKGAGAPEIAPVDVSGEILVEKDRALLLSAGGDGLEPIDVAELTLLPQRGQLAYRYYRQPDSLAAPSSLDLTVAKRDNLPVAETIVSQALVEAVLTDDKSVSYRCRYRLRTSERQRLSLELPKDVEIQDVLVAGRRVDLTKGEGPLSRGWDEFRVNVTRATPSEEPFVLAIAFRAPFRDVPLRGRGGNLKLPLPRIGGAAVSGHLPVSTQQLRAAIWVPQQFKLVGQPADFTPCQSAALAIRPGALGSTSATRELDEWFGEAAESPLAFSPAGQIYLYDRLGSADGLELSYWRTAWYTSTVSGALLLVGLVLARTSLRNRLTIVLLATFAVALYSLKDADLVVNLLGVARYGLIATAAYWLIHALPRPRQGTAGPASRPGEQTGSVVPQPVMSRTRA